MDGESGDVFDPFVEAAVARYAFSFTPPSAAVAVTNNDPSTVTSSHCSSAHSSRTSARSCNTPPRIFCEITSHSGPNAGRHVKINPGPFFK